MRRPFLDFLECFDCHSPFRLEESKVDGDHVMEGRLVCTGCEAGHFIRQGVPRFIEIENIGEQEATADHFGYQWTHYDEVLESQQQTRQFLDWLEPLTPDDLKGKTLLDGGCGMGRHSLRMLDYGAKDVVGIDLSPAVNASFRRLKDRPNFHVIQADIFRLPLKPVFDHIISLGVVHHTPDPKQAFCSLSRLMRPGGSLGVMVYGRENNGWIVWFVNPVRKVLTRLFPSFFIKAVAFFATLALYPVLKLVYRPLNAISPNLARHLFYHAYMVYIAPFSFREIHLIVYDHLNAPIAHYTRRQDFEDWFRAARLPNPTIIWRNQNTWQGFATRPLEENSL